MAAQSEFWLYLHQLSQEYKSVGRTPAERIATLTYEFQAKGESAQKEILDQMAEMSKVLGDFYFKHGRN